MLSAQLLRICTILLASKVTICLRVSGTFDLADDFFQFVAKFGFQKTDPQNIAQTQGFIYGNITYDNTGIVTSDFYHILSQSFEKASRLPPPFPEPYNTSQSVTLAVLDRGYFLSFYGNRTVFDKGKACQQMFKKISSGLVTNQSSLCLLFL